jgi:hypothetical protein
LVPAVAGPVVETAVLRAVGPAGSAALAPQVTAPPPFDLFHDLRWISVYHDSWWTLAAELGAMLALRSAYVAWIVQAAWPQDRDAPPMPRAALRAAVFYAAAAVLLLPWVTLLFGMAIVHLSYLFFVAVPATLAVALAIHRGALAQAAGWWWRWRPSWSSLGWSAAAFVWLTLAGAAISSVSLPLALPVAAAAGALNALAVSRIARSIAVRPERPPLRRQALVPVALGVTFAVVIGGTAVGFASASSSRVGSDQPQVIPTTGSGHPVLAVTGFNSRWSPGSPTVFPPGFVGWRYSYRGVGAEGAFLPYGPQDTLQPLLVSAARMSREVDALYQAYGRPVSIVAESEGALVTRVYLVSYYRPASHHVDRVIILDMPLGLSTAYFPPRGAQGWGVGSGWSLRGVTAIVQQLGPLQVSTDAPLFWDIANCGPLIKRAATDPPPLGVDEITIEALADAVDDGASHVPASRSYVVVSAHGGLMSNPAVRTLIDAGLSGTPVPAAGAGVGTWVVRTISALSSPWRTPGLVPGLNAAHPCPPGPLVLPSP